MCMCVCVCGFLRNTARLTVPHRGHEARRCRGERSTRRVRAIHSLTHPPTPSLTRTLTLHVRGRRAEGDSTRTRPLHSRRLGRHRRRGGGGVGLDAAEQCDDLAVDVGAHETEARALLVNDLGSGWCRPSWQRRGVAGFEGQPTRYLFIS